MKVAAGSDGWNATLYDDRHSFISMYGNDVLDLLAPQKGETILDLGCGTGDLTHKIKVYGANSIGVDNSKNMIAKARMKYPEIQFDIQDATDLPYNKEFEAVFSNAALHWIQQPDCVLQSIYRSLKQGGRFVAEFGGKGNVEIITNALIQQLEIAGYKQNINKFPWFFPSIGEYTSRMEYAGFNVVYAHLFERPTPLEGPNGLRNWLSMFGHHLLEGIEGKEQNKIIANVEELTKSQLMRDGIWIADYRRLRVIGIKNE